MDESPQKHRYLRALALSNSAASQRHYTASHDVWFQNNHKLLTAHAPADGPDPVCIAPDCGKTWPCDTAETAMGQVGVTA